MMFVTETFTPPMVFTFQDLLTAFVIGCAVTCLFYWWAER